MHTAVRTICTTQAARIIVTLKGLCHKMNQYILNKLRLFPQYLDAFLWKNCKGVCLVPWNYLLILKILPVILFQVAAFEKSCSESHLWFWKLFRKPTMTCTVHWNKSTNGSEGKKLSFFKKASRNFKIIFLFHKEAWKFLNHLRMKKKYWYNLFIWWPSTFTHAFLSDLLWQGLLLYSYTVPRRLFIPALQ